METGQFGFRLLSDVEVDALFGESKPKRKRKKRQTIIPKKVEKVKKEKPTPPPEPKPVEKLSSRHLDVRVEPPSETKTKSLSSYHSRVRLWLQDVNKPIKHQVSHALLKKVARSCEVVDAILKRVTDDIIGAGYEFPARVENPDKNQLERLIKFFSQPNPDDSGDEWLESFVYDLALFADAYVEKSGDADKIVGGVHVFDGDLIAVWHVDASTMEIIPDEHGQLPDPPDAAYKHKVTHGKEILFAKSKILHSSRFRQGRLYGTPPLLSLFNVIAGQINLTGFVGNVFSGKIPKTIVSLGDLPPEEVTAMLAIIEKQIEQAKNPYGVIATGGGTGFQVQKLIEAGKEGELVRCLEYYREEICSVFGMPPIKMGWGVAGKIGEWESQLDTWYDVVESFHKKIEKVINHTILPDLGITDWFFKFNSIRPKKADIAATALYKNAMSTKILRQENVISVNEGRVFVGLETIDEDWANDMQLPSPTVPISGGGLHPPAEHPAPKEPQPKKGNGKKKLNIGDIVYSTDHDWDEKQKGYIEDFQKLNSKWEKESLKFWGKFASGLGKDLLKELDKLAKKKALDDVISPEEYQVALNKLDKKLKFAFKKKIGGIKGVNEKAYLDSFEYLSEEYGVALEIGADDLAVLDYYYDEYIMKNFSPNTLAGYEKIVVGVIDKGMKNNWSWKKLITEMKVNIDSTGAKFPHYFYSRVARTEIARIVTEGHLRGHNKLGFTHYRRIVVVDEATDKDLCEPFADEIYTQSEAYNVIPAHPHCRCAMIPEKVA